MVVVISITSTVRAMLSAMEVATGTWEVDSSTTKVHCNPILLFGLGIHDPATAAAFRFPRKYCKEGDMGAVQPSMVYSHSYLSSFSSKETIKNKAKQLLIASTGSHITSTTIEGDFIENAFFVAVIQVKFHLGRRSIAPRNPRTFRPFCSQWPESPLRPVC